MNWDSKPISAVDWIIFLSYEIGITSFIQNSWFKYINSVTQQFFEGEFEEHFGRVACGEKSTTVL